MTITTDALHAVRHAVSHDRKAPASIRCILVERVGDVVRAVATDKHRLVVCEEPATDGDESRALLDPETLEPAVDVADDFPAYERFLEAAPGSTSVTLDAATLLDAIEAGTDDDPIGLAIVGGELLVGADGATVHVEPRYAHDAAVAAGPGPVTVELAGATAPVVFRSDRVLTLVMPVRIKN